MRRRTWSRSLTTSKPATRAVPAVGFGRVQRILIVVDLPAPFGPRKPNISPGLDAQVDALTASTTLSLALYVLVSPTASIAAL